MLVDRAGAGNKLINVSVECAACALLLGRPEAALQQLGLAEAATNPGGTGARVPDPNVRAFVVQNSPNPSDKMPGVRALVQSWLQEVALGTSLGSASRPADLAAWAEAPRVKFYLQVRAGSFPCGLANCAEQGMCC